MWRHGDFMTLRFVELNATQKKLLEAAERARETAYCPYSSFHVGAALLAKDGTIHPGSNYENVSYSMTICAERSAIFGASARGYKLFKAVAISVRSGKSDVAEPAAPCGACMQVLSEASFLAGNDIEIISANTKKDRIMVTSIKRLAPVIFDPRSAGIKRKRFTR